MRGLALLLSLLVSVPAVACSSNCYLCHTNIPKDRNHAVLKSCTKCHPNHTDRGMTACGSDCFDCHSYSRVMSSSKAHRVLVKCVKCHQRLKEKELPPYYRELLGG